MQCVSEGRPLTHGLLAKRVNSENLLKQEKNRRNAGEGVRKEKWSKKGVSFPKQEGWQVCIKLKQLNTVS